MARGHSAGHPTPVVTASKTAEGWLRIQQLLEKKGPKYTKCWHQGWNSSLWGAGSEELVRVHEDLGIHCRSKVTFHCPPMALMWVTHFCVSLGRDHILQTNHYQQLRLPLRNICPCYFPALKSGSHKAPVLRCCPAQIYGDKFQRLRETPTQMVKQGRTEEAQLQELIQSVLQDTPTTRNTFIWFLPQWKYVEKCHESWIWSKMREQSIR